MWISESAENVYTPSHNLSAASTCANMVSALSAACDSECQFPSFASSMRDVSVAASGPSCTTVAAGAAGAGAGVEGPASSGDGWGELAVESAGVGGISPGTVVADSSSLAATSIAGAGTGSSEDIGGLGERSEGGEKEESHARSLINYRESNAGLLVSVPNISLIT